MVFDCDLAVIDLDLIISRIITADGTRARAEGLDLDFISNFHYTAQGIPQLHNRESNINHSKVIVYKISQIASL